MGFFSFNETYYLQQLKELEGRPLSVREVYRAKQLLKVLDDLTDEGYTALNEYLEGKHHCLTRLRAVIANNGGRPFAVSGGRLPAAVYGGQLREASALLQQLEARSAQVQGKLGKRRAFLQDICGYCQWIDWQPDTACIFLLRDALLPYLWFHSRGRQGLYAWPIGRRFLQQMTGMENFDDILRLPIYEALESGRTDFAPFRAFCTAHIRQVLAGQPALLQALQKLLGRIPQSRILVIESGYCGTMPLLLAALDERVDFRLFTTAPFLYETYQGRLYCRAYEKIRLFETLYSQDLLLQYAAFRSGRFYMQMADSSAILQQALLEMQQML